MAPAFSMRHFEARPDFERAVRGLMAETLGRGGPPHLLLLSGGRTPLPVYAAIEAEPCPVSGAVHVGLTDERHVPVDAPESNYGAMRPMLRALALPEPRVLRVPVHLPLDAAAQACDAALRAFFDEGGRLSVALLGVGTDGHTCSLFTEDDLRAAERHYAIAVRRPSGPDRISVTPAVLNRAERVVVLMAGADKAAITAQLREAPDTVVAGRALSECPNVELWRV